MSWSTQHVYFNLLNLKVFISLKYLRCYVFDKTHKRDFCIFVIKSPTWFPYPWSAKTILAHNFSLANIWRDKRYTHYSISIILGCRSAFRQNDKDKGLPTSFPSLKHRCSELERSRNVKQKTTTQSDNFQKIWKTSSNFYIIYMFTYWCIYIQKKARKMVNMLKKISKHRSL